MAIMNFNYSRAISQANQVEEVADQMLTIANRRFQTVLDSIEACWHGDASRQFINHCTNMQSKICSQANTLNDIARRIRTTARIIEDAEQRAKELQRRRAEQALKKLLNTDQGKE